MRSYSLFLLLGLIYFTGCSKDDNRKCEPVNVSAPSSEVTALKAYLSSNGISATEDSRGFFYTIQAPGSGTKPTACSNVSVNYVGRFTNGTQFEATNGISFNLSGLIVGWQEAIPLIAPGGSITLYLPPSLGYGSTPPPGIPANSILIFDITLNRVL